MDPNSPISAEEILYRRVPKDNLTSDAKVVKARAFAPSSRDADGLSLYRALFHSPEEIARVLRTGGSQPVWVVELPASDVLALHVSLKPDPLEASKHPRGIAQPGHVLIAEMNAQNAKSNRVEELQVQLADIANCRTIHGPFDPPCATSM